MQKFFFIDPDPRLLHDLNAKPLTKTEGIHYVLVIGEIAIEGRDVTGAASEKGPEPHNTSKKGGERGKAAKYLITQFTFYAILKELKYE